MTDRSPETPVPPTGLRVLVVDDDIVALIVVQHMLEAIGLEVIQAANVRAAETLLTEGSFDLVIVDYLMPDAIGLELLAHTGDTPFILLSGVLERDDSSDPRLAQVTTHLTKPVSSDELRKAVLDLLPLDDEPTD